MLADSMGLPFPRNRLPMFADSVLHGHYLYSQSFKDVCVVWRDGRDVMVSWYFHKVVGNELSSAKATNAVVKYLGFKDPNDIQHNLSKFIEYSFQEQIQPRFSWTEFVDAWLDKPVFHTKYEQLLSEPEQELKRALAWFGCNNVSDLEIDNIISNYSFSNQSGRVQGDEESSSYLRKGVSGDWVNHFTLQSKEIFNEYAGAHLIRLGYESDYSWLSGQ
tara:strand:+ start:10404 stop:11057 length:654 start_codon:yes stop_codon:yes gene_type:complete